MHNIDVHCILSAQAYAIHTSFLKDNNAVCDCIYIYKFGKSSLHLKHSVSLHHYCNMLAVSQLLYFLIIIGSEALVSQVYASWSESDYYNTLPNRHGDDIMFPIDPLLNNRGDGEKNFNTAEQVAHKLTANDSCSDLWFISRNGKCHCGSTLYGVVTCNEQTKEVMVLDCYCMTLDSTNQTVVGTCLYNCINFSQNAAYKDPIYHSVPSDCSALHRRGALCGECENDYFPRAYSYDMDCIKCTSPNSWLEYIAVAYLPLTIFIAIIFVFRISVVSPKLHAFVSFAQIVTAPVNVQIIIRGTIFTSHSLDAVTRTYASVYGVWNLDFFRTLIPDICLHLTTLEVLALDYLIAVYPMLLMVIAYILVELHGYGFRPVLLMWRPFHYFFVWCRREWNIQTSIVDTFVTFFILSTTKLFSVSFFLLIPTLLHNANGDMIGIYSFYNPNLEYMRGRHLPYALLALTVIGLFIILPLILLVFSSFRCVRNCFGRCRGRIRVLEEFLHAFQQYYKDGTNGTTDCRWYAAYYILVNLGLCLMRTFAMGTIFYIFAIIYFVIVALPILLVEPYKEEYAFYNVLDCVQYLWLAIICSSVEFLNLSGLLQRRSIIYAYFIIVGIGTVPLIYITALGIHKIGERIGLKFFKKFQMKSVLIQSLPDRIYNPNQYKDNCGYVPIHPMEA